MQNGAIVWQYGCWSFSVFVSQNFEATFAFPILQPLFRQAYEPDVLSKPHLFPTSKSQNLQSLYSLVAKSARNLAIAH